MQSKKHKSKHTKQKRNTIKKRDSRTKNNSNIDGTFAKPIYVCKNCGKGYKKSEYYFKEHLKKCNPKSETSKSRFDLNNVTFGLSIFAIIITLLSLPMPWFDNHSIWNDLFEGKVNTTYLRSDIERLSFQVINNRPYMIEDVKISSNIDCGSTNENHNFLLKSELKMIPSGQGDIFYVSNNELLHLINISTHRISEYKINMDDYPISFMTKNKHIYTINQKGEIAKENFRNNFSIYDKTCEIETTLNYTYHRFGKKRKKSQVISELGVPVFSAITSGGSNQPGTGVPSESFIELCKSQCTECAKYPDVLHTRDPITSLEFCRLWFCRKIKEKYPDDLISCMVELQGICTWPSGRNLSICADFGYLLKTECMYYENDTCRMSGLIWE